MPSTADGARDADGAREAGPAPVRTFVLLRELSADVVLASPLGDLKLTSVGDTATALLEQRMFMAEHLALAEPEVIARFALPAATTLARADVLVPRPALPRDIAVRVPIAISYTSVPVFHPPGVTPRGEAWLTILPLAHTFYLGPDEDAAEAVAAEVKRLVSAQERSALEYLELLPGRRERLERVEVQIDHGPSGPAERAASARRALAEHERRKTAVAILESVSTPLHTIFEDPDGRAEPLVARERELELLSAIVTGEARLSALLVGPRRVGKTALLRALHATARKKGKAPLIYSTSGAQLIAGMSGLGQWQERLRRVFDAAETLDAILHFEDVGDLFAERGSSSIDLPGAMKPWLEEGRVRWVGEIDGERLDLIEQRNAGFFACLTRVALAPMSVSDTLSALAAHVEADIARDPDAPTLAPSAQAPLVELCERHLRYQAFPGKAIDLYRDLVNARALRPAAQGTLIDERELLEAFSLRSGVPLFLLREDSSLSADDVRAQLSRRVIGQDEAVRGVADTVCVVKAAMQPEGKPLSTLLFVGPTGVGKTELARALAVFLFGREDRLIRLDMSELSDPGAADRLVRGADGSEGVLLRKVRAQPFSVVLLDEIEKAHPQVFDLLLQIAGDGRLSDGRGRTAYFHDTIVIMTSNLGASHQGGSLGFERGRAPADERYLKAVRETFRPELVNRIDRIVVFKPPTPDEARRIVKLVVDRVAERRGMMGASVHLEISEAALDRLADDGLSPVYGARALRRHVEDALVAPASRIIAPLGDRARGGTLHVRLRGEAALDELPRDVERREVGPLVMAFTRVAPSQRKGAAAAMEAVSDVRREIASLLSLAPIGSLREHVAMLVAELAQGDDGGREVAERRAEHHRLSTALAAVDEALDEARSLEDLALSAYLGDDPVDEIVERARLVDATFSAPFCHAMLAEEPRRDAVTLLCHELDSGGAIDGFVIPLLDDLSRRGLSAELHVPGDTGAGWPSTRAFGPARSPYHYQTKVAPRGDRPRSVLLRLRGPDAVLFAFERGVHRYVGLRSDVPEASLSVGLVALRTSFSDAEWSSEALSPPDLEAQAALEATKPVRVHDAQRDTVLLFDDRRPMPIGVLEYFTRLEDVVRVIVARCARDPEMPRGRLLSPAIVDSDGEVRALLRGGQKIEAIRLYREKTQCSLREALEYVEALGDEVL